MRGWKCLSWAMAVMLAVSMTPVASAAARQDVQGQAGCVGLYEKVQRAARAQAIDMRPETHEQGEIIVVYRGDVKTADVEGDDAVATIPESIGEVISEDEPGTSAAVSLVEVPEGLSVGQAVVAATDDPNIAYAQPNWHYHPLEGAGLAPAALDAANAPMAVSVNDEYAQNKQNNKSVNNQWWLYSARVPEAWEYAKAESPQGGGEPVAVAVLDTGINFEHPDLVNNILADYAYDAVAGEHLDESPDTGALSHGSHVAGIIAAEANNQIGIAGTSYNGKVLPIAVFTVDPASGQATCSDTDLIKAYDYLMGPASDAFAGGDPNRTVLEATNTRIVNMSLGGYGGMDYAFEELIAKAEAKGVLTVAAGGNGDSQGNPRTEHSYPSDYDEVMSVVALQSDSERAYWSDYNEGKDIAAPGYNIWSTWYTNDDPVNGDYHCTSGTSMATPLVCGCAALLWAYDPDLTVAEVKDALYSTAVDLGEAGKDPLYGWGRIDVAAAIESLGAAHITAERQTMGRTSSQVLTAKDMRSAETNHAWIWSLENNDLDGGKQVARIEANADGSATLTALNPGSVVVNVEASDTSGDELVSGKLSVTVTDITVPGGVVVASDAVNGQISVSWKAADAAVKYRVLRSTSETGGYAQIGSDIAADADAQAGLKMYSFTDKAASKATYYYYKVVPVGEFEGEEVVGAETAAGRGYFSDKKALAASIDAAEDVLAAALVSADGHEYRPSVKWTTAANKAKLDKQLASAQKVFASQFARQAVVDASAKGLDAAVAAYDAALAPGTGAISISGAKVTLVKASAAYSGKTQAGAVKSVMLKDGTVLGEGDFTVSAKTGKAVGSYQVTVSGAGDYTGTATATFKVVKAANPMKASALKPSVSFKSLKAKAQKVAKAKAYSISGAQGTVTFAKVGSSKLSVDKKTGTITVPKGLAKRTYSIKVKVAAAGGANYNSGSKQVTVNVKVG